MINNLILIVVLVVIFRIIFEILFFSKSIKEGFPGKKNWDKTSSTGNDTWDKTSSTGKKNWDKTSSTGKDSWDKTSSTGKDSWDTTQDTEDKKNEMNSNCCPENNYSYETYPVPDNCLDGEDDISCLWRVKRSNQIININGAPPFKAYNKKIYDLITNTPKPKKQYLVSKLEKLGSGAAGTTFTAIIDSVEIVLKEQKKTLTANIKSTAIEHLNKFKAGAPNGGSGNAD